MRRFQEANARHGRQLRLGENLALGLWCYIDTSYEKAKQALQPIFEEHVKFAAPLACCAITTSKYGRPDRPVSPPTLRRAAISRGDCQSGLVLWHPQDTVAYLQELPGATPGQNTFSSVFRWVINTTISGPAHLFRQQVAGVSDGAVSA